MVPNFLTARIINRPLYVLNLSAAQRYFELLDHYCQATNRRAVLIG
jgi:hypothetical protein